MVGYVAKRFVLAVLVAITVSLISFALLRLSGDLAHAIAGPSATASDVEAVRKAYRLDRPIALQYVDWARRAAHGDLGDSFFLKEPVWGLIVKRLPVTLVLGLCALLFAAALSIPLGVLAALRPRSWIDRVALALGVLGQALPSFWFALLLIIVFGLELRWLPVSGAESWRSFVLPAIALGYYGAPALLRLTRNGMLEALGSDYIRTARAKGLRMPAVVFKHALRNA